VVCTVAISCWPKHLRTTSNPLAKEPGSSDKSGLGTQSAPGPFLRVGWGYTHAKAAKVSLDGSGRCVGFA
jgi:hypothetical protein